MLIGIAGKTGSGKNFVASVLEGRGWRTLDLDQVAHRALSALAGDIDKRFGGGLLLEDGSVDRRKLGRRVFDDPEALAVLEGLTYPWIEDDVRTWMDREPGVPAAVHAVNLHKTDLQHELDAVLWIRAPRRLRRRRVMARDDRTWKGLKGRFRAQKGLNPKLFSSGVDIYSVRNSGNRASLERSLDRILRRLGP